MTSTERDATIPPGRHDPVDARLVLGTRPLRADIDREATSRFGEDIWQLGPAQLQHHQSRERLDFQLCPPSNRLVVKHLRYALLAGPRPPREPQLKVGSIRRTFPQLLHFARWVDGLEPRTSDSVRLAELTLQDFAAYAEYLRDRFRSPAARAFAQSAVRLFWRYRSALPRDRIAHDPADAPGWGGFTPGAHRGENSTPRIPEHVLGALFTWSLRLVDQFAADILAAREVRQGRRRVLSHAGHAGRDVEQLLRRLLDEYVSRQLPLPGHRGRVNHRELARQAGCSYGVITNYAGLVDQAVARVGITSTTPFDAPITAALDGKPWLERVVTEHLAPNSVAALTRMLHVACYVIIAYLSGMRDSEIKHLRRGCVHTHRDADGQPFRHTITGLAFKGEHDPTGVPATWVIGAPAARAVAVLDKLQSPEVDLLFAPLRPGRRHNQALPHEVTVLQLNEFVRWVDWYCRTHGRADSIPLVDGRTWKLTTTQFRRTLAWHIARRPGGAIAGAIQYRHLSVQMFEGYAGTSDSGFRAEVEAEQALARGEHLLAMTTRHEHHSLAGPAAAEAERRLAEFDHHGHFEGQVVTDPRRLARILRRNDPQVHPGDYVLCVFDPAKALCLPRPDAHKVVRPSPAQCRPLACGNVALTPDNLVALRAEQTRLRDELDRRPALPPVLHRTLAQRHDEIAGFLSHHAPETP